MIAALSLSLAFGYEGYYRTPDLAGGDVVFTAEGDLWLAPITGGEARRITGHPGDERSAHFSPDGKRIAFTGEYDGNTDVFVMPASGGEPKRLTFHPGQDDCVGFTPDGRSVIIRSQRTDPNSVWRLYTVPVDGGDATEIPVGWASRLDVDPLTGRYAFTRLGRENATWKRYRGGSADDIWVGDPKTGKYAAITTFTGPDSYPMWSGDRLFFLSDQGGTANLWSMKADGTDRKRLTSLDSSFDARNPSMSPDGRIVFGYGGEIWLYDPKGGETKKIAIDLPGERRLARTRYTDAGDHLDWFELAPDADRLIVGARGELFSVPAKPGVTLPITRGSGARESYGWFSPDGKRVCYVTDQSGEEAIASADAWGRGDTKIMVPAGKSGWHFPPQWAPDGKRVAWSDETFSLYVAGIDGGTPTLVDKAEQAEIREYTWSPDGRFLAYTMVDRRNMSGVWVFDTQNGQKHRIAGTSTEASAAAWDPDGRYLYFLSSRRTNPVMGIRDFSAVLAPETEVFAVLLRPDVPNPFADNQGVPPAPQNLQATAEKKKKDKKKKDKKEEEKLLEPTEKPVTPVVIDWTGLDDRIVKFPLDPGNYWALAATSTKVFVAESAWKGMNETKGDDGGSILRFDLEDKEGSTWLTGTSAFTVQAKANKMAVEKDGALYLVDTNGGGSLDERVDLSGAVIEVDPREEWRQIYLEAWRFERDFFWSPDMGGVDWNAVRERYAALLPRLATRYDLVDLIGEMIGELGTSHTYVWGGDRGVDIGWTNAGLLGAELARVPLAPSPGSATRPASAVRITRILRADPADGVASPLLEPGTNVHDGDFVVAVNHQPIRPDVPFDAMLQGLAGKRVLLTVNASASLQGAREVAVTPLGDDAALRHADWVRRNREYVASKTGGKIGYLHVPDMGAGGLVAFETWLYPQSDKEGLVVDVRWNRGGFVSQLLLEKLRRPILGWDRGRGGSLDPYPYAQRRGPFVVLTNEFAGSDGDIFPKAVQVEGLAPVIGVRSWGGVIGIRMDKPLVDGGALSQPEYAYWFRKGGWSVENHGVDPDIAVQWSPEDVANGVDTQLDRAIQEVVKLRDANPPPKPPGADDLPPKKSRDAYKDEK
jgi:tricorn protease